MDRGTSLVQTQRPWTVASALSERLAFWKLRESGICLLTLTNYVWLAWRTVLHAATTADAVAIGATNPADKHDAVAMGATSGAAAADGPGRRHATLVTSSNGAIDHPLRLA